MNVKMHMVKTTNTATICVACGGFRADFAATLDDGSQTEYGVHRKCKPRLHVKRARKVSDAAAE